MENPFEENKSQRPVFLMVLCVLTFICSGWGILTNLFSLMTAGLFDGTVQMEEYSQMVGNMPELGSSAFFSNVMASSLEVLKIKVLYIREIAIADLVLSVISFIGALAMFQLRRFGFYLYAAAQILMLLVFPYFAGFSIIVVGGIFFSGLMTLVFIILYALHLKYMDGNK